MGDHLLIEEEGCFFPCEVLKVVDAAKGIWLVHYLGWDDIRDEKVGGKGSGARVMPDTPENRLLCADLTAQIRRIQRKGKLQPSFTSKKRMAVMRFRKKLNQSCIILKRNIMQIFFL